MAEANLTKGCFDQALVTDEGLQHWLYTLRLGPEIVTKIYRIPDSEVAP